MVQIPDNPTFLILATRQGRTSHVHLAWCDPQTLHLKKPTPGMELTHASDSFESYTLVPGEAARVLRVLTPTCADLRNYFPLAHQYLKLQLVTGGEGAMRKLTDQIRRARYLRYSDRTTQTVNLSAPQANHEAYWFWHDNGDLVIPCRVLMSSLPRLFEEQHSGLLRLCGKPIPETGHKFIHGWRRRVTPGIFLAPLSEADAQTFETIYQLRNELGESLMTCLFEFFEWAYPAILQR